MELRNFRAFVEVVRHGGFSSAARSLSTAQPTISKAVRQLEEELGTPLLDRLSQGVRLTPAGEVAYRRALSLLAERDSLRAELEELRGLKRGELRLGLPPLGSNTLYAPLFAAFRQRYPDIEIRLQERGSQALETSLLAGEIELAGSLLPVSDAFDWQPVQREPLMVLLPKGHDLAGARLLRLDALRETPFILYERDFALSRTLIEGCKRRGFEPIEAARSGQTDFIVALVAAGMGLAVLPRSIALERRHPNVHYAQLQEDDVEWYMAMIWRRGAFLSHAAQAWLELVSAQWPMPADAAA